MLPEWQVMLSWIVVTYHILDNEYSRIKKIQVPEGQKKKKIDINKDLKESRRKKES